MGKRRARPVAPDAAESDSDDEPVKKRKKKKSKSQQQELPSKIGSLPPKKFGPSELPKYQRVLWQGEALEVDEAAASAARRQLGLRVPEVRKKPCKFWAKGECSRGAACRFAHTEAASDAAAACPPPVTSLADRGLPRCIGRAMIHLGHREPSPIQAQAWPAALQGHDLLCRAPTGSGKTLAYLLPAAAHGLAATKLPAGAGPAALILVPTRELAMQVHGVCQAVRRPCGLRAEAIYGGEPREDQVEAMESGGIHVLVATTGRLVDMLLSRHVRLSRVTMLVLDEADQLLLLGFSVQVSQVVSQLRPDRQTLLFSATLSERLEKAAGAWLRAPLRIYADEDDHAPEAADGDAAASALAGPASDDESNDGRGLAIDTTASESHRLSQVPASVEQRFVMCESGRRTESLLAVLAELGHHLTPVSHVMDERATPSASAAAPAGVARGRNAPRVLVFVNEIKHLKKLASRLRTEGVRCQVLHGEKSQAERNEALRLFRAGAAPVLLASDLASRGLDIRALPAVINFDPPANATSYVHRAGRTGRQGAAGLVVSLLRQDVPSRHLARQLRGMLERAGGLFPAALQSLLTVK